MYAYKVEIEPVSKQKVKIHQGVGVCRYLYNAYIKYNEEIYEEEKKFVSHMEFDKYVNHTLKKQFPWIDTCHSKARKKVFSKCGNSIYEILQGTSKISKIKEERESRCKNLLTKKQ